MSLACGSLAPGRRTDTTHGRGHGLYCTAHTPSCGRDHTTTINYCESRVLDQMLFRPLMSADCFPEVRSPCSTGFWFPKSLESWLRLFLVYCNTKDKPLQTSAFPITVGTNCENIFGKQIGNVFVFTICFDVGLAVLC